MALSDGMADKRGVLDARRFELEGGLDLASFISQDIELNQRMDMASLDFKSPEPTSTGAAAIEVQVHWGLMVLLIGSASALGIAVGIATQPLVATPALVLLSAISFALAERWIPETRMRSLGIVWAIIALRTLDGLILNAHDWGWFGVGDQASLFASSLLALLVIFNLYYAGRHNSDFIAAQATLVLLLVSTVAGSLGGVGWLVSMIILSTLILHGTALHRNSGTLAVLGVAASNLWIGVHALLGGYMFAGFLVTSLNEPTILIGVFGFVNAVNAAATARLSKADNWFGDMISHLGFGRPTVWVLSVCLGLIGATLAIIAVRGQTSIALSLISLLALFAVPSYLRVKSNESIRTEIVSWSLLPGLGFLLLGGGFGQESTPLALTATCGAVLCSLAILLPSKGVLGIKTTHVIAPSALISAILLLIFGDGTSFSAIASISGWVTAAVLIRHGSAVTDGVLVSAAISLIILCSLVTGSENGGWILILILVGLLSSLTFVAVQRNSAAIASTVAMLPWLWILTFGLPSSVRLLGGTSSWVSPSGGAMGVFALSATLLQVPLGRGSGKLEVILPNPGPLKELADRMRRSGLLRVWSVAWVAGLIGWVSLFSSLDPRLALFGPILLLSIHASARIFGRSSMPIEVLSIGFIASGAILSWLGSGIIVWMAGLVGVLLFDRNNQTKAIILTFSGLAGLMVVWLIHPSPSPTHGFTMDNERWLAIGLVGVSLGSYLPRASRIDNLLGPALSSVLCLLTLLPFSSDLSGGLLISTLLALSAGAWLAAQGEVRSAVAGVAERERRVAEFHSKYDDFNPSKGDGSLRLFDPELLALAKRKGSGEISQEDVESILRAEIHHRPVIVLVLLSSLTLAGIWGAWISGSALAPVILGTVTLSAIGFVALARWRSKDFELPLPDVFGVEVTIVAGLIGIVLVHLSGRLSTSALVTGDGGQEWGLLLIACSSLIILAPFARENRIVRLRSVLDFGLVILLIDRFIAAIFGRMAAPLRVDLRIFDESTFAWLGSEIILLLAWMLLVTLRPVDRIVGSDARRSREKELLHVGLLVCLSSGPVAVIVSLDALIRSIRVRHPELGSAGFIGFSLSLFSLGSSSTTLGEHVPEITAFIGLIALIIVSAGVVLRESLWTLSLLVVAHLLLLVGIVTYYGTIEGTSAIAILLLSTVTWLSGLFEQRRGLRALGAIDLTACWIVTGLAVSSLTPSMMAIIGVGTVSLLAVVTWLSQRMMVEILED